TEKAYFDQSGMLIRKAVARYDDRGNQVEAVYFSPDGKRATIEVDGVQCSRWTATYDERGILLKRTFFDHRGRQIPARGPSLQFSVMCLDLIQEEQKPPTLQHLFYEIPIPSLPFRIGRFHVVNCWTNGRGQFQQSVKILNPTKTKILIETGQQNFIL